jgi:hypothetical protein
MDEICMDVIPTAEPVRNAIPLPIPTISGNIIALDYTEESQNLADLELETLLQDISRHHITSELIIFLNLSKISIE